MTEEHEVDEDDAIMLAEYKIVLKNINYLFSNHKNYVKCNRFKKTPKEKRSFPTRQAT